MQKKLKLNCAFRGHKAGSIINIEVSDDGTPKDSFWRRRLKDAKIDNCVEFVDEKKETASESDADESEE